MSIRERLVHALRVVRARLRSVRMRSHAYGGTYLGDEEDVAGEYSEARGACVSYIGLVYRSRISV